MIDYGYVENTFCLEGKTAIVTGGNSGIGRAIALSLARLGADIVIAGRNEETLKSTLNELSSSGGNYELYKLDVSSRDEIRRFFEWYSSSHQKLDIFVNNAGYSVQGELQDTSDADIDGLIDTNLKGAICCMQHAADIMIQQKSGRILVITSINGVVNPHPTQGMYSVTKFALQGAMKAMAETLGEYGITVNSLAPGAIDTPMNSAAFADPGHIRAVEAKISLRRIGTAEEIGDVAAVMVSDAFSYMTGTTIVVDGGMMLRQK